jgi:protein SCO1/2
MKKQTIIIIFLIIISFTLTALLTGTRAPVMESNYSHLGGGFELQHVDGVKTLESFKGKATLLYFGFTTCPDICPLALNKLSKVLDKLSYEQRSKINKVFISVDYKRDDASKVNEYVKFFAEDYIGLSGSESQIKSMTKKYAVHFEFVPLKNSALGYTVDHTSRYFLLNKDGKIVNSYSDITNDDKFIKQLKASL